MGSFKTHNDFARCLPEILTNRFELLQTFNRMLEGYNRKAGPGFIDKNSIVLLFTPINSNVYLHKDLLVHE